MYIKISLIFVSIFMLVSCGNPFSPKKEDLSFTIPENYEMIDNSGDITVAGESVEIYGQKTQLGDILKDTPLDMKADYFDQVTTTSLANFSGITVLVTVPSLDTPVCSMQTKQLEFAASEFTDVNFIVISNDTPFALQRFCSANNIMNLHTLSDARTREFGKQNGLYLPDYGLLARTIIILDENKTVQYIEYASDITQALDLMNALAFLQNNMLP